MKIYITVIIATKNINEKLCYNNHSKKITNILDCSRDFKKMP